MQSRFQLEAFLLWHKSDDVVQQLEVYEAMIILLIRKNVRQSPSSLSSSSSSPSQPRERRKASSSAGISSLSLRLPELLLAGFGAGLKLTPGFAVVTSAELSEPAAAAAAGGACCCVSGVTAADSESPCPFAAGDAGCLASPAESVSALVDIAASASPAASASAAASSPSPRGARLGERLLRRSESKKLFRSRSLEAPTR